MSKGHATVSTDAPRLVETADRGKAHPQLTPEKQTEVRNYLSKILESPRFLNSHRSQALLKYVVEKTLEGDTQGLKERTLGVEIFGRDPDYDTNADPAVRLAMAELRKKLAQYYYEAGNQAEIRIELPTGTYTPTFHWPDGPAKSTLESPSPSVLSEPTESQQASIAPAVRASFLHRRGAAVLSSIAAAALLAGVVLLILRPHKKDAFETFWAPVSKSASPVLLSIGHMKTAGIQLDMNPDRNPLASSATGGDGEVFKTDLPVTMLEDATAMTIIGALLSAEGKTFTIRPDYYTRLGDFQKGPVVLLGSDNDWTIQQTKAMRFHFEMDADKGQMWIEDQQKPGQRIGAINLDMIGVHITESYSIAARVIDPQTRQPVIIVAGVFAPGTQAATDILTTPAYLNEFAKNAPKDWATKNLELLIYFKVVDKDKGPPRIVASYSW